MSTSILSVRVSAREREMLERAAEQARTNLSDFVRRRAVEAAEAAVLAQAVVTIPAAAWEKFERWVESPAQPVPELERLARTRPTWAR